MVVRPYFGSWDGGMGSTYGGGFPCRQSCPGLPSPADDGSTGEGSESSDHWQVQTKMKGKVWSFTKHGGIVPTSIIGKLPNKIH